MELTYDQIRCLPKVTDKALLVCKGFFEDSASWTGVPLKSILDMAEMQAGATDLVLVSADGYKVKIPLVEALEQESLLAYEVNGQVLPILHGFPLRAVFPGRLGGEWIKWLVEIQVKINLSATYPELRKFFERQVGIINNHLKILFLWIDAILWLF